MTRMTGRTFFVAAAFGAALAAAQPAMALDDGQDNIFNTIIGFVGVSTDGKAPPDIDYRERPPLVLPGARTQLRAPLEKADRGPAWPQDPDVLKRRAAAEKARIPIPFLNETDGARVSNKRELMAGRGVPGPDARPNTPGVDCSGDHPPRECYWVKPDVLRSQGVKAEKPEAVVGEEPQREWLTQPPKGYRKATVRAAGTGPAQIPAADEDGVNQWSFLTNPFKKKNDDE